MSIFADEFRDMMPSTITVQSFGGRTDDGTAIYATPISYQCLIDNTTRNTIGSEGQTVVCRGRAYLDTADAISVNDAIVFPDGTTPIILNVNQLSDETGPCGTVIEFQ